MVELIVKGCVYKILRTENHGFETRIWNTVLQKSVYKSFLLSVFLALRHSAQLVPWQKVKQGARFSISIIVTSFKPCLRSLLRL